MAYVKLFEGFILEGKIDDIKDKYAKSLSIYDIEALCSMLPNSSNIIEWVLKVFKNERESYGKNPLNGQYMLIDILVYYFTRYNRIKRNIPVDKRDITQFKSVRELINVVDQYNDYDKIHRDRNVDLLFSNEMWLVFVPKTFNASKKWGWVRFCSVYDDFYFKNHNINNKSLVYIIHKFDSTRNTAIECFPDDEYKIWNYLNDVSGAGSKYTLGLELSDINDGHLDIEQVLSKLPDITVDDVINHVIMMIGDEDIEDINSALDADIKEFTMKGIRDYLERSNDDIINLLNVVDEFI